MTRNFFLFLAATAVFFGACELNPQKNITDPLDETAPMITFVNPEYTAEPSAGINLIRTGEPVVISIDFEDNRELASYTASLSYDNASYYAKTAADPMARSWAGNISGEAESVSINFITDGDAYAGPYRLNIQAEDSAGNTYSKSTWYWVLNKNDSVPPTVTFVSPVLVDTFNIGTQIMLNCNLADNDVLERALVRVRNTFSKELLPDSEEWVTLVGPTGSIRRNIYIPPIPPGDYNVEIFVTDGTQNLGVGIAPIYIRTNN